MNPSIVQSCNKLVTSAMAQRYGYFQPMVAVVPAGEHGEARVEHYIIDDSASSFTRMRQALNPGRDEFIPVGHYVRLFVRDELVMTDTPMELRSNFSAVSGARGDVLLGGLGIGLVALAVAQKPGVRSVTVIEKSADVVCLVEDAIRRQLSGLQSAGFVVFTADVRTWEPQTRNIHRFDYTYLDIWPNICTDDYADHVALRRRYRRWASRPGGKVESWNFEYIAKKMKG